MAITQTTIDLKWQPATDNVRVTGYKVFNDSGDTLIQDVGNVLSYTVTGLTANTQYSFYIKAYDAAANESTISNTITAKTLP